MRKGWKSCDCSSCGREYREDLINVYDYLKGGCKELTAGPFWWSSVRQKAQNTGDSIWMSGNSFSLWEWPSTGPGCPERLRSLLGYSGHSHGKLAVHGPVWAGGWTKLLSETPSNFNSSLWIQQCFKPPMSCNILLRVRIQDNWFSLLLHTFWSFDLLQLSQPTCWPDSRLQFNIIKEKILW